MVGRAVQRAGTPEHINAAGGAARSGLLRSAPGRAINAVSFAGTKPVFAERVDMETRIPVSDADVGSLIYVYDIHMYDPLETSEKSPSSNGAPIWENGNAVNGHRTEAANQIETGDLVFGNLADAPSSTAGGLAMARRHA